MFPMRRIIPITIIALFATWLACSSGAEDEIRSAEKSWSAAVCSRDYAALDRIFHDQLIYAHSTGAIESKADYTARLKSGVQRYDAIDHKKMTIRVYGNSAVAHSIVQMTGESNGKPFNDQLMMIHFWVKQGGQWQLAAHQTTKLQ
jgi:ketosteroid isomerase-like protein